LITIDSSQYNGGEYSFENSTFTNIKSESGTIINIKNMSKKCKSIYNDKKFEI
jgi:outer membrane protein assembly factor BamA